MPQPTAMLPPSLYMVLLGGRHPQARIEVHDVVLAVGTDLDSLKPQLQQAWFGRAKGLHIDAWARIAQVSYVHQPQPLNSSAKASSTLQDTSLVHTPCKQTYRIAFADVPAAASALKLFFVNIGGVLPQQFGEQHRYRVLAAFDAAEAKRLALNWARRLYTAAHVDALFDVDDCMSIDLLAGRYIHLHAITDHANTKPHDALNTWENCYLPI